MLSPIALAVDAYCGLFGNPPAHVRAHAERMRQIKARAYDLALQEALRIERATQHPDGLSEALRHEVRT